VPVAAAIEIDAVAVGVNGQPVDLEVIHSGCEQSEDGGEKHNHARYDTLNRLQTLTPPTAFSGTASFGFSYDGLSRRTQMTRPNGMKSVYAYDNLSRLLIVLHQSGSTTLGKCGTSGSMHRHFWRVRSKASPRPHKWQDASGGNLFPRLQVRKWSDGPLQSRN
jgi:YD repeat-containing protein